MFWFNKNDFTEELENTLELYRSLETHYLKLRKEHWELLDKYEAQEDEIMHFEELIEKLAKELDYKTWLVTQYILKYPDYMYVLEKKRSKIKNRTRKGEDNEGVEL